MNLNLSNLADMTKVKPILYALGAILLMVFAYWISTQWTGNVSTHFADQVLKEKEAMVDKNYSNTVSEKEREIAALKQKVSQAGNRIQTAEAKITAVLAAKNAVKEPQSLAELKEAFKALGYSPAE